jgi:8-oxo-dGTP diphosphatase
VQRKGLGSAAAILDDAGRILLVKHSYGRLNWELPGGLAESGESPVETVTREVREETGLLVDSSHVRGDHFSIPTQRRKATARQFLSKTIRIPDRSCRT